MSTPQRRFARYALAVLAYTVLVILWGGYVRASGAGAGCGAHWPLCNGEVVPRAPAVETLVEFSHRLMSGLLGVLVLGLIAWAFRVFPRGSFVRRAALATGLLVVIEALIGAGLVLFEYVAYNPSVARAYWMAAHLTNTLFLLAALTLTAWGASGRGGRRSHGGKTPTSLLAGSLGALLLLGVSGAVTALGDTLALGGGLDPDQHPVVATLLPLRILHPLLAVGVALLVLLTVLVARLRGADSEALRWGRSVILLFAVQLGVGLINVELLAPIPVQLLHLLLTDLIWIGLVVFVVSVRSGAPESETPARQRAGVEGSG